MKTLVIMNPVSKNGRNAAVKQTVKKHLARLSPTIEMTRYVGHATTLAADAVTAGYESIITVGGDGTVNEVLNGIIGSSVTLGIIPTGTANDIAAHYAIPTDIERACRIVLNGIIHRPDVISVNDWYYLTVGGIGLPCDTLAIAESIKSHDRFGKLLAFALGSRIYLLALIAALMKKRWGQMHLSVTAGEVRHDGSTLSLIIGNQTRLGGHFQVLPRAKNDDGLFDVFVLRRRRHRFASLVTLGKTTTGNHESRPDVKLFRTDSLEIESHHAMPFFGDGQIGITGRKFAVRILPGAVRLIVPGLKEVN